ncbi:sensor histidine kinase [Limnohabitans sp.]|uniref:sensor histidine kinase n=1 Tax=Limnohabitans sp. TaxID=1907725 RepID=UPI0038BCF534
MSIVKNIQQLQDKIADQVKIILLVLVTLSLTGMALMMSWNFLEQKERNTLTKEGIHFQAALRQQIGQDEAELISLISNSSKDSRSFENLSRTIFEAHPNYLRLELRDETGKLIAARASEKSPEKWPSGSRVELPPGVVINFFKAVEEQKPFWAHSYAPSGQSAVEVIVPSVKLQRVLIVRFNPNHWLPPIGTLSIPNNIKVYFSESAPQETANDASFATPLGLAGLDAYLIFSFKNHRASGLSMSSLVIVTLGLALAILLVSYSAEVKRSRKSREQLAQQELTLAKQSQLSTLGEISTTLAHELNQPLATITNYIATCEIRLKQLGYQDKILDKALNDARGQTMRAGEVVQSIRNFLKRGQSLRATVDFEEAIAHLMPIIKALIKEHRAMIEVSLEPGLCARVDPALFEQIVLNLCKNGLDAMVDVPYNQRKITIRAHTTQSSNGHPWARVDVIDKGHGVKQENADKLFESFFTTKTQGMGIGLNLSRSVAESNGGRILWKNNDDGGATFSLELPKYTAAPETHS